MFQQGHRALAVESLPALLRPRKGRRGLIDHEKVFSPDFKSGEDIFDLRGIDRQQGVLVVVRPDQYIADVLPLSAHRELADFFAAFMCRASTANFISLALSAGRSSAAAADCLHELAAQLRVLVKAAGALAFGRQWSPVFRTVR